MKTGDRVKLQIKINARSTDPVTGAQYPPDSFRPLKKGLAGTVEAIQTPGFAVVKFDGVTTRQEFRDDILKVTS